MRTDILDFHDFYQSPLGRTARDFIAGRLVEIWGDGAGLAIAGFGYANPYLELFTGARARFALAPGGQGVFRWPQGAANAASLVAEHEWPIPDASLDRVLIVHGLEEAPQPQRLMREVWRVLKDDGRVIIVAAHRRGLWSVIDTTPFAAGRPYHKRRLQGLLRDAIFRPTVWNAALFFPPFRSTLLLRAARAWERAGSRLWPGLGGVLMLEAEKDMLAPVGLVRREGARALRPAIAAPQPIRRDTAPRQPWLPARASRRYIADGASIGFHVMALPQPRPGIMDIKPYTPGASQAPGAMEIHKLSSNESALGASPKAIEAYRAAADKLFLYPEGASVQLREKIGEVHGLDPSRIICGAGSDEILQLLTHAYVGEGDNIIMSAHGFVVYALAALSVGAEPRYAPEKNLTGDVEAMLALVDEKTRIVFIANPNNPTGTYLTDAELRHLRENLREDILLVIDAAYAEFVDEGDYSNGAALVDDFPNVVMTRTFSKIYGLAALRLGWGYCPPLIADALNRIRGPFNVSTAAQAAGVAAVEDQDFVRRNFDHNRVERDYLQQQIGGLGLEFVPSHGNFILVKFPEESGRNADDVLSYLKANGVIVRDMGSYGLGAYLRVSVGPKAGNRKFIELLEKKFSRD